MEIYGRVRRAVRVEGRSQRAVARDFGLSRETVRKTLQYAVPPGYQRQQPIKRPKLGPWLGVIDAILEDDKRRGDRRVRRCGNGRKHGTPSAADSRSLTGSVPATQAVLSEMGCSMS